MGAGDACRHPCGALVFIFTIISSSIFIIPVIILVIRICIIVTFFLRAHLFVLAPLSQTSDEVGTIRPSGSRCRKFGRDPCSVSRVASHLNLFGRGHT